MAATERFEMRVPVQLLERVDEARGQESRASYVKRAVEAALAGKEPTRSAPPRALGPKVDRVREAMDKAPAEYVGCERHPEAGAYQGPNGRWWCLDNRCTRPARRQVA